MKTGQPTPDAHPGARHVRPLDAPDLAALLVDPARIADVPAVELPALVLRIAALQSAVAARLAQEVKTASPEPPLTAQEAARRLNVGVDWIREHGAAKGIEIRLSAGTVRYDPDRVEQLRAVR